MSNWLKIGLPILVAVLLVVSAVAVTLAVTGGGAARQAGTVAYQAGNGPAAQFASGPYCWGNNRAVQGAAYGPRYGGYGAWRCHDLD